MTSPAHGVEAKNSPIDALVASFLPEGFEPNMEQLFRAKVVVVFCFSIVVFGPLYAVIVYLLTSSIMQVTAILIVTGCVVATPFMMRHGGSFFLLGNWLVLCGYLLIFYLAGESLGQSVLIWQIVFAVLGGLIAGRRSAIFWLVLISGTTAYFYLTMLARAPGEGILFSEIQLLWEMILIIGMFMAVSLLTFTYDSVKVWALQQVQSSEAQTRAILDAAPDGIITLSPGGRILEFNPAAESLFNYDQSSVLGTQFSMLIPEIEHAPREPIGSDLEELLDGALFDASQEPQGEGGLEAWLGASYETKGVGKGGEEFAAEVAITRIKDGRLVAMVRDITSQKKAQQALREARDRAVEANEAKSRFLANMSHELRTPLNAIIGYSELVREDLTAMGETELMSDVEKIGIAGDHLLLLINEILDLSKVEAGEMELCVEKIELPKLIKGVVDTIQPIINANENTLGVDIDDAPDALWIDQTKLRQILLNLLSNASKFTQKGLIRLQVFSERRDDRDFAVFEVTDRGIGIPEDKVESLFEAFVQADASTTRDYGGTGLGLTICKRFTEMMGGEITVHSTVGEGSTFRVKMPVSIGQDSATAEELEAELPSPLPRQLVDVGGGPRVFAIDDDPTVHNLLTRFLATEGFVVQTSLGQMKAIAEAKAFHPDIITLDVLMPSVDGWRMLELLKSDEQLADVPVVMLTIVDDKNMGFSLGADDYLTKPIKPARLVEVLSSHVELAAGQPVLIAEDDDETREILRRTVEDSGFQPICVKDGREALDQLDAGLAPCAILLDLMMPRLDGFEVLEQLRERPKVSDIPVVIVSAADLTQSERQQLEQNVYKVMKKGSYGKDELIAELRSALGLAPQSG